MGNPLCLKSLNHISLKCRSLEESIDFYQNFLGFSPIRRPGCFDFDGAWLFNYGVGIHLIQSDDPANMRESSRINPKNNHISFQCESMAAVEKNLKELKIEYVKGRVVDGGIFVDQIFFHDPDGTMIEICNCDNLPVVPLTGSTVRSFSLVNCNVQRQLQQKEQQIQQAARITAQRLLTRRTSFPV